MGTHNGLYEVIKESGDEYDPDKPFMTITSVRVDDGRQGVKINMNRSTPHDDLRAILFVAATLDALLNQNTRSKMLAHLVGLDMVLPVLIETANMSIGVMDRAWATRPIDE